MIEIELKKYISKAVIAAFIPVSIVLGFYIFKLGVAHSASLNVESKELADYIAELSPNDPQTQFAAGVLADAEFDPANYSAAELRFERAVALSPHNYLLWLQLAKSRESNGNIEKAKLAFEKAKILAPHYSSVQWAYGNFLVRNGDPNSGFAEIRNAVSGDSKLADPAISLAMQLYQDEPELLTNAVGNSSIMNSALALMFIKNNRSEEAVNAWNKIPNDERSDEIKAKGKELAGQLAVDHKYKAAIKILSEIETDNSFKPNIGQIWNGGFEGDLTSENTRLFDWAIDSGSRPQIALMEGQKAEGKRSLLIAFGKDGETNFRQLSQVVAIEPNTEYTFEYHYLADIMTRADIKWVIFDQSNGAILAETPKFEISKMWQNGSIKFITPEKTDGIKIILKRDGCNSETCRISGNLSLDSIMIDPK